MALSDTCSDTLNELGRELVWYSDWGYKPEQLIPVIDAMYNLATFTAGQDSPPNSTNTNPSIGISRVVIRAILGAEMDDDELGQKSAATILTLLPKISKVHSKLAKSLDDVYIEITTNTDSFMTKMYPNILSKLESVRSNQA
jgi:hypothetical protein